VQDNGATDGNRLGGRHLVRKTAEKLRELILAQDPESYLGSLNEIAKLLGVGIVTVQQAARVLEHEGLLTVRRGPGGGYYGTRPDEAALERSVAAFMRVHGATYKESLEIISLLDTEIIAAAARCKNDGLHEALRALSQRIDSCNSEEARIAFEEDYRDLLFKMDAKPLFELLGRVAMRLYKSPRPPALFPGEDGVAVWKECKRRMLDAILKQDEALARFEADRYRQELLARLQKAL
jgi:DNA-binding FadR family transcriptional regulator